ncbi:MAG: hypothetical protein J6T38_06940 [Bacteroidaceae bacterium]|nr:hypothetical protein [Bacteroidaceae bacterium]
MIHTQLLKADKPYQIISAAGMVGIQVATLIVTEEKTTDDGGYLIDTHSHPVVNYGNKEGLEEELKYFDGYPDERYKYTKRMQPEGAVWNKVEVRDVYVLGLAGAKNLWVDIETFIALIPSQPPFSPIDHVWNATTAQKIHNLSWYFGQVGLNIAKHVNGKMFGHDSKQIIQLELEEREDQHLVVVNIIDEEYADIHGEFIYFKCCLDEDPSDCIYTIKRCMTELSYNFEIEYNPRYVFQRKQTDQGSKWSELMENVVEQLNK